MYSKTSLGADQLSGGLRLSRRGRRVLLCVLGVAAAVAVGAGVWSAVGSDKYGPSANGCVNVTIASSTGGATLHYCGTAAKSFCRSAYAHGDRISLLARPQCALAGLGPAKVSGSSG
jgi:predicted metal-binding membrane protein